jgi:hypothetical protein
MITIKKQKASLANMKSNMTILTKLYPGINQKPRSELIIDENQSLFFAATSWGTNDALQVLKSYSYNGSSVDNSTQVTGIKNIYNSKNDEELKKMISEINQSIFEKHNKNSYLSGLEILAMKLSENKLSWVSFGQPSLALLRDKKIILLQSNQDLSFDYEQKEALPSLLLGTEMNIFTEVKSVLLKSEDILILYSGAHFPTSLLTVKKPEEEINLLEQQLFNHAVKANPEQSFWISLIKF